MIILYALLFTFIFSLFDYFGYNISARKGWVNEKLINPYRITQTIVQVILILTAGFLFDWWVAIIFTLLWWTWLCDLMFYWIGDIIGVYGRGYFRSEVLNNQVTWAWWTAYGLFDLIKNGKDESDNYRVIKGSTLLWQAWIGIMIAIIINFAPEILNLYI